MSDISCLHCHQTKAQVKANKTFCATVDYYGDCMDAWPQHRWKDWSDKELNALGVLPEHYGKYRRCNVHDFNLIDCTHQGIQHHTLPDDDYLPDYVCVRCWADARETGNPNA